MKKSIFLAVIAVLPIFSPKNARAWRETGHYTVCEIAYRHLDPQAKQNVDALMDGKDFAEQCTWPDRVRKTPAWKHTYPWHFIDIDDNLNYFDVIKPAGDAVQALIRMEDVLRDPQSSREQKIAALKLVSHITGDIHQPLHVGRSSDQGGNLIKVTWFGRSEYTYIEMLGDQNLEDTRHIELHKVWDLHMIERLIQEKNLEDGTQYKQKAYADLIDGPVKAEETTFLDWMNESQAARNRAYAIGNGQLGQEYYNANVGLLNERIVLAGHRLAGLLNRIFRGEPLTHREMDMRQQIKAALQAL